MKCFARKLINVLAAVLFVAIAAANSQAAAINYGDFSGSTVDFLGVTENSITDPTPLFGAPLVVSDAILFNPTGFGATSSGGSPSIDITDGLLKMMIMAKPGKAIDSLLLEEAGDYTLAGVGTVLTQTWVNAAVFVQIIELTTGPISPISLSDNLTFTPNAGNYDLVNEPGIGIIWTGSLFMDIQAALSDLGIEAQATKLLFTMDNTLVAQSESGSVAFIQKKNVGGFGMTVNIIPVPATLWTGLALLGSLGVVRRSRR